VTYFTFLFTIPYAIWFASGFAVPKDDRYRREIGAFEAIVVVPMAQVYLIA
jgi:hypothetical protein